MEIWTTRCRLKAAFRVKGPRRETDFREILTLSRALMKLVCASYPGAVAQTSKSVVSRVSKPAGPTPSRQVAVENPRYLIVVHGGGRRPGEGSTNDLEAKQFNRFNRAPFLKRLRTDVLFNRVGDAL
jgi:hypothetical protein